MSSNEQNNFLNTVFISINFSLSISQNLAMAGTVRGLKFNVQANRKTLISLTIINDLLSRQSLPPSLRSEWAENKMQKSLIYYSINNIKLEIIKKIKESSFYFRQNLLINWTQAWVVLGDFPRSIQGCV